MLAGSIEDQTLSKGGKYAIKSLQSADRYPRGNIVSAQAWGESINMKLRLWDDPEWSDRQFEARFVDDDVPTGIRIITEPAKREGPFPPGEAPGRRIIHQDAKRRILEEFLCARPDDVLAIGGTLDRLSGMWGATSPDGVLWTALWRIQPPAQVSSESAYFSSQPRLRDMSGRAPRRNRGGAGRKLHNSANACDRPTPEIECTNTKGRTRAGDCIRGTAGQCQTALQALGRSRLWRKNSCFPISPMKPTIGTP